MPVQCRILVTGRIQTVRHAGPTWGTCAVTATTLAEVIDLLFKTIRRPNGSEHSMEEAARACTAWLAEHGGGTFSKQYLAQLRSGKADNPSVPLMEALAAFFDVDPGIWFLYSERSQEIQANLALALQLAGGINGAGIQAIAMRHGRLNAGDRAKIAEFIATLPKKNDSAG